jgi:hypothetical protein
MLSPMKVAALLWLGLVSVAAFAEGLPPPTRTAYKCVIAGKVSYSDEPCVDAKRVDLEPTRGLNKSTGTERLGQDVRREQWHESLGEAVKPLTGLTPEQFKLAVRRQPLAPQARSECYRLDRAIPDAEAAYRLASEVERGPARLRLLALRKRFKELQC